MDRHPVRQDHLPEPGRQRPAGELELAAAAPASGGFTLPLILWLSVQLLAVSLTAWRVPLWAKYPPTGELLALQALLATQLITSALLFPVLLRTTQATTALIVTAWPFALVAAAVSSTPTRAAIWAESYVSIWFLSLWLWRANLHSARSLGIASAVAISLVLSGSIFGYLMHDFPAESSVSAMPAAIRSTPLISVFSLLTAERPLLPAVLGLALLLLPPILISAKAAVQRALKP